MGMPAFFYRIYYRAHSVKSLKRNILAFCGIGPIRSTLIGMVESRNPNVRGEDTATMMLCHREGGVSVVECTYESRRLPDVFPETMVGIVASTILRPARPWTASPRPWACS